MCAQEIDFRKAAGCLLLLLRKTKISDRQKMQDILMLSLTAFLVGQTRPQQENSTELALQFYSLWTSNYTCDVLTQLKIHCTLNYGDHTGHASSGTVTDIPIIAFPDCYSLVSHSRRQFLLTRPLNQTTDLTTVVIEGGVTSTDDMSLTFVDNMNLIAETVPVYGFGRQLIELDFVSLDMDIQPVLGLTTDLLRLAARDYTTNGGGSASDDSSCSVWKALFAAVLSAVIVFAITSVTFYFVCTSQEKRRQKAAQPGWTPPAGDNPLFTVKPVTTSSSSADATSQSRGEQRTDDSPQQPQAPPRQRRDSFQTFGYAIEPPVVSDDKYNSRVMVANGGLKTSGINPAPGNPGLLSAVPDDDFRSVRSTSTETNYFDPVKPGPTEDAVSYTRWEDNSIPPLDSEI